MKYRQGVGELLSSSLHDLICKYRNIFMLSKTKANTFLGKIATNLYLFLIVHHTDKS